MQSWQGAGGKLKRIAARQINITLIKQMGQSSLIDSIRQWLTQNPWKVLLITSVSFGAAAPLLIWARNRKRENANSSDGSHDGTLVGVAEAVGTFLMCLGVIMLVACAFVMGYEDGEESGRAQQRMSEVQRASARVRSQASNSRPRVTRRDSSPL